MGERTFPLGGTLAATRLPDEPGAAHGAARTFCLGLIETFYGIAYRPDWHADLDSLLEPAAGNHFSALNRGAFWVVRDAAGDLVATAGLRHLGWKPNCVALFPGLYPGDGSSTASLWRLYVREGGRGRGLGSRLTALCEGEARRLSYGRIYLHASATTPATVGFWRARGYRVVGDDGETVHFDKVLGPAGPGGA